MTLNITLVTGLHDRSLAFLLNRVNTPGLTIDFRTSDVPTLLRQQAVEGTYDVAEFSLSSYAILRSQGDLRFLALPVFPSRAFRHSSIVVNTDRVQSVEDLLRVPVGITQFQQTAVVWIRGMLEDEYGVDSAQFDWVLGGLNTPAAYSERVPIDLPPGLNWRPLMNGNSLNAALVEGRIGAVLGARLPAALGSISHVQRLFQDWPDVEKEFYLRRRIFPIMHAIVVRSELLREAPWIAKTLYDAFRDAREAGRDLLRNDSTLAVSLPWLGHHLAYTDSVFGDVDPFSYGLEANRSTLDTFLRYAQGQELVRSNLCTDDLFTPIH